MTENAFEPPNPQISKPFFFRIPGNPISENPCGAPSGGGGGGGLSQWNTTVQGGGPQARLRGLLRLVKSCRGLCHVVLEAWCPMVSPMLCLWEGRLSFGGPEPNPQTDVWGPDMPLASGRESGSR